MRNKWNVWLALAAAISLALAGCGRGGDGPADAQGVSDETLIEYVAEGVGTFRLPEGFEEEVGESTEGLPYNYALFTKGEISVYASRFGAEACEQAGLPLPASLAEFSAYEEVRQGLPKEAEDEEFTKDSYGNLSIQYADGDEQVLYVLKEGASGYGTMMIRWPGDDASGSAFALWASRAELE